MRIKLYQCLCENNRMNKETFLQNEITIDGNARNQINKYTPQIVIEDKEIERYLVDENNNDVVINDDIDVGFTIVGQVFNYMYIEDWERYYFIEPITFTNNKMYVIDGTLDTLMSFKNKEWRNNPLYITRRTKGNKFIYDNMIQYKYKKKITTNNGETISTAEAVTKGYETFGLAYGDYSIYQDFYCVVVAVSNPVTLETYEIGGQLFKPSPRENGTGVSGRLKNASANSSFSFRHTTYYVITPRMLIHLCAHINVHSSIMSSILSITILPYAVMTENSYEGGTMDFFPSAPIDFTTFGFSNSSVKYAKYGNNDRFIFRTIEIPEAQRFNDFEPHTTANLYIPFADTIQLNLQSVRGGKLRLYYYVDFNTSNSFYELYNVTRDIVEHSGVCQLGYKFNITTSNAEELRNISENNTTSFLFGAISSSLSLLSGNPMGVIGASRGLINNMSQFITRENSMIPKQQAQATAGNTGAFMPLVPYIVWNIDEPTFTSFENFEKNIGLPFNDYEFIYNITDGEHIIVGDTSDIIMSSDVTSQELETFKNTLASGFYK